MRSSQRAGVDSPGIVEGAEGKFWALRTHNHHYVIGLEPDETLVQRYWGAALGDLDLAEFERPDRGRWESTFQHPAEGDEQIPVDGGARWSIPSLQVRFPNGVRALQLRYEANTISNTSLGFELEIVLRDAEFNFHVALHYRVRIGSDVIERWITLRNHHAVNVATVMRADSANWLIPDLNDYRLSGVHGHWGGENQLARTMLPVGDFLIGSRQGATGHDSSPWLMIDDGATTEQTGRVWSIALAWSGSWRMVAKRRSDGGLSVSTGFSQDGLEWALEPGETLCAPSSFGLYSCNGFGDASRGWHSFVRKHLTPQTRRERLVVYNSWEATRYDLDEAGQIELANIAADVGVELFVIDDGWFGNRASDASGLGDWRVNPTRFPNGLSQILETVRARGMRFGLWVEPEMVNPDSDLYRAHPEWIYHWPDRKPTQRRNQFVLNFARDDVQNFTLEWLRKLISTHQLDFIKWDMNRPFTEAGWPTDQGHQDHIWIEHTRAVYNLMDALRREFPTLTIEACASGGARTDLAILQHADQIWASDNTDALDRQVIQEGFSQIFPAETMGAWVTDQVNPLTSRSIPLDYRFHVSMAGSLGIGGNLRDWTSAGLRQASEYITQFKSLRTTIHNGDLYRLEGTPGRGPSAIQFVDETRVVVFCYEPQRSLSSAPRRIRLQGLEAASGYLNLSSSELRTGAFLMEHGIPFNPRANYRGWNNTRFSTQDYVSSVVVFSRQ